MWVDFVCCHLPVWNIRIFFRFLSNLGEWNGKWFFLVLGASPAAIGIIIWKFCQKKTSVWNNCVTIFQGKCFASRMKAQSIYWVFILGASKATNFAYIILWTKRILRNHFVQYILDSGNAAKKDPLNQKKKSLDDLFQWHYEQKSIVFALNAWISKY